MVRHLCYNLSFPANVKTKVTRSFQRDFKLVLKRTMFCDLSTFFPGLTTFFSSLAVAQLLFKQCSFSSS